jgi:hypothetical protein
MLEPIIYWAKMTNDHIARVPFFPKLLKKIWAMGCPRLLPIRASRSWPMQNVRATFTAASQRFEFSDGLRNFNNETRCTEAKDAGDGSGQNDGPWDSGGCIRNFLRDMYAGVEPS